MKTVLAFLLVLFFSAGVLAAEPVTDDFAEGFTLEVVGKGPLFVLPLPAEVYRTVRRADFGDIRVFNGEGETLPHSLRTIEADQEAVGQKESVPFFPFYAGTADRGGDLALHVTRNSEGTIIDIDAGPETGATTPRVAGYLLDLSGIRQSIRELEFFWKKERESSMVSVNIRESNDLEHWHPLVNRATLADLQYAGQRIERRTVPLPNQSMKYLQVTWETGDEPLALSAVGGSHRVVASEQRREWLNLGNGNVVHHDAQLAIEYMSEYHLPITGAQISFPEINTIARVALQSRADDKAGWATRCEQVFYSLALDNTPLRNRPCTFSATTDRQWRLAVQEDGAGLSDGRRIPTLQLGLRPRELVFLGRGARPYLLAFGSGRMEREEIPVEGGMIVETMRKEMGNRITGQARLDRKVALGGREALAPPPSAMPWKKWLLWTVLVLSVGLLAIMARNLLREMKKEETAKE